MAEKFLSKIFSLTISLGKYTWHFSVPRSNINLNTHLNEHKVKIVKRNTNYKYTTLILTFQLESDMKELSAAKILRKKGTRIRICITGVMRKVHLKWTHTFYNWVHRQQVRKTRVWTQGTLHHISRSCFLGICVSRGSAPLLLNTRRMESRVPYTYLSPILRSIRRSINTLQGIYG